MSLFYYEFSSHRCRVTITSEEVCTGLGWCGECIGGRLWTFYRGSNEDAGLGSGVCVECYVMNDRVHVIKFHSHFVTCRHCYRAGIEFHVLSGDAYAHLLWCCPGRSQPSQVRLLTTQLAL